MDDGEKAKEVVLDSAKVKKGKFSFSGVRQTPNIALIKDRDGETYPLILEKGKNCDQSYHEDRRRSRR